MSKSNCKKVVSIQRARSDLVHDRFAAQYQCYARNIDVLRALVVGQLPENTDLAVRVHVWNCQTCRSEYLKLKAVTVGAIEPCSSPRVPEKNIQSNAGIARRLFGRIEGLFRKNSAEDCVREAIRAGFHTEDEIAFVTTLSPEQVLITLTDLLVLTGEIRTVRVKKLRMYFINDVSIEIAHSEGPSLERKSYRIAKSKTARESSAAPRKSRKRSRAS